MLISLLDPRILPRHFLALAMCAYRGHRMQKHPVVSVCQSQGEIQGYIFNFEASVRCG